MEESTTTVVDVHADVTVVDVHADVTVVDVHADVTVVVTHIIEATVETGESSHPSARSVRC